MKHLMTVVTILLFPFLLLAGCGSNSQPSGPPPLTYATGTVGTATPGGVNTGNTLQILRLSGSVSVLAWSPDGMRLAVAYSRNTDGRAVFQVWDAAADKQLSAYNGQLASACCLAWSPDGKRIASAGGVYAGADTSHVRIWDAATGNTLTSLLSNSQNELNGVQALAWLANSSHIAALVQTGPLPTASTPNPPRKEELQIWDTTVGTLLSTYPVSVQALNAVASPDGKEVAVGNNDGTVQVWDVASGKLLLTYRGHSAAVYTLSWSPDGRFLASGSGDTTVQVWDAVTGKTVFTYHGHSIEVHALAWSPDGRRIVSGSGYTNNVEDHPIQVWDAFTGQHVFDYDGQSESIAALAWSPDGSEIASAGSATVQVWQAPPES